MSKMLAKLISGEGFSFLVESVSSLVARLLLTGGEYFGVTKGQDGIIWKKCSFKRGNLPGSGYDTLPGGIGRFCHPLWTAKG